jgi:hypothetical protein
MRYENIFQSRTLLLCRSLLRPSLRKLLIGSTILIWISTAGCLVKTEIIRTGMTPIPENVKGVLYVATNKKIQVGIEGTSTVVTEDVGGYYLIHKNDLKAMVEIINERK